MTIKSAKDGRSYIHVGRKLMASFDGREMFAAKSRDELINKLYDAAFGTKKMRLKEAYKLWLQYREEIGTLPKTMKEDVINWNSYIEGSKLAGMEIEKIRPVDIKDFFLKLNKNRTLTWKRISGI